MELLYRHSRPTEFETPYLKICVNYFPTQDVPRPISYKRNDENDPLHYYITSSLDGYIISTILLSLTSAFAREPLTKRRNTKCLVSPTVQQFLSAFGKRQIFLAIFCFIGTPQNSENRLRPDCRSLVQILRVFLHPILTGSVTSGRPFEETVNVVL